MSMLLQKINLMDFDLDRMRLFCVEQGEKPYRAEQLMRWIHYEGCSDFSGMSNLSQAWRAKLSALAEVRVPDMVSCQESSDGTRKWLLKLSCGNCIETVFIPEASRGTLCVSSQVGCALDCSFCSTGKQGFNRNLTVGEIIGQVWLAARMLSLEQGKHDRHITNVVMMGMGEPLLNFDNVVMAMNVMMDDFAYGLSKRRVTLSTSGIIPAMQALREKSPVALAVSLHAPNDELRDQLVPINRKYPLADLKAMCRGYFADEPRRYVTFEYVMLDGVNDQPEHATQLIKWLRGIPSKVNLIPFNPFPLTDYKRSPKSSINAFRDQLMAAGINTITRKTRGDDIDAACGQLAGSVLDKTRRAEAWRVVNFKKMSSSPISSSPTEISTL